MTNSQETPVRTTYDMLRKEVNEDRVRAKMSVEYYGAQASKLKFWIFLLNFFTLLFISGTTASLLSSPFLTQWNESVASITPIAFSIVTTCLTILSVVNSWSEDCIRFLNAQTRARKIEASWDNLWLRIETEKPEISEMNKRVFELREEDIEIQQSVQPHIENEKLVNKIQEYIQNGMSLKKTEEPKNDGSKKSQ